MQLMVWVIHIAVWSRWPNRNVFSDCLKQLYITSPAALGTSVDNSGLEVQLHRKLCRRGWSAFDIHMPNLFAYISIMIKMSSPFYASMIDFLNVETLQVESWMLLMSSMIITLSVYRLMWNHSLCECVCDQCLRSCLAAVCGWQVNMPLWCTMRCSTGCYASCHILCYLMSACYEVEPTCAPCSFAVLGPTSWNSLPQSFFDTAPSLGQFQHRLKTLLFHLVYGHDLTVHSWLPRLSEWCTINAQTELMQPCTVLHYWRLRVYVHLD